MFTTFNGNGASMAGPGAPLRFRSPEIRWKFDDGKMFGTFVYADPRATEDRFEFGVNLKIAKDLAAALMVGIAEDASGTPYLRKSDIIYFTFGRTDKRDEALRILEARPVVAIKPGNVHTAPVAVSAIKRPR